MSLRILTLGLAVIAAGAVPASAQRGNAQGRGAAAQSRNAAIRFQEMDRNNDRVITRAEWRGSAQSFKVHDWNGDGKLSGDEVRVGAVRCASNTDDFDYYEGVRSTTGPTRGFRAPTTAHNRITGTNGTSTAKDSAGPSQRNGVISRTDFFNQDARTTTVVTFRSRRESGRTHSRDEWRQSTASDARRQPDGFISRTEDAPAQLRHRISLRRVMKTGIA